MSHLLERRDERKLERTRYSSWAVPLTKPNATPGRISVLACARSPQLLAWEEVVCLLLLLLCFSFYCAALRRIEKFLLLFRDVRLLFIV